MPTAPTLIAVPPAKLNGFSYSSDQENYLTPPKSHVKSRMVRVESDEVHSDASTSAESQQDSPVQRTEVSKQNKYKSERLAFVKEYKRKQKTEMCKNWEMTGTCRWGHKCSYAHGAHEILKRRISLRIS